MAEEGLEERSCRRFGIHSAAQSEFQRLAGLYPVITFYILAFAISWLGFVPLLVRSWGIPFFASRLWLMGLVLPAVGPGVAAGIVSSTSGFRGEHEGTFSMRLRRSFLRPVSLSWWLTTVLLSVGTMFAASVLTRYLIPGHAPVLCQDCVSGILIFSSMSLAANPFEEIVWR